MSQDLTLVKPDESRGVKMLATFLIVFLSLVMLGFLPSRLNRMRWGYFPSGGVGILLVIVIFLLVTNRI
jgi:ABC-type uncharacterized transport system permease subunit